MCLAAIAIDASVRFPLVVAANRDEFFHRLAAPLAWWTPDGGSRPILAGRDLAAGGTWMGLGASGRFALLTNVRRPGGSVAADAPSRGLIVPGWLQADEAADPFWARTALSKRAPFNLIAADFRRGECFWASNEHDAIQRIGRGVVAISNAAALDAPWPKVQRLKTQMQQTLSGADGGVSAGDRHPMSVDALTARLFASLADQTPAADEQLPHTGLSLERERQLSPAFIHTPGGVYGTRCSTLVITERAGGRSITHVLERSFPGGTGRGFLRRAALAGWPPTFDGDMADQAPHPPPAWRRVEEQASAEDSSAR
jgi:uncharacterized protein with NRDE domain